MIQVVHTDPGLRQTTLVAHPNVETATLIIEFRNDSDECDLEVYTVNLKEGEALLRKMIGLDYRKSGTAFRRFLEKKGLEQDIPFTAAQRHNGRETALAALVELKHILGSKINRFTHAYLNEICAPVAEDLKGQLNEH